MLHVHVFLVAPLGAGNMAQSGAYVPGFGWVESNGENTAVRDEDIYENGNKIGSMG